jgi:hypothetical protein
MLRLVLLVKKKKLGLRASGKYDSVLREVRQMIQETQGLPEGKVFV